MSEKDEENGGPLARHAEAKDKWRKWLEDLNPTSAQLIELCAHLYADCEGLSEDNERLVKLLNSQNLNTTFTSWVLENARDPFATLKAMAALRENAHASQLTGFITRAAVIARRDGATRAARERHLRDPKREAKLFVYDCWKDWVKYPARYKNATAFARDMLSKFDALESEPVVTGWVRAWRAGKRIPDDKM